MDDVPEKTPEQREEEERARLRRLVRSTGGVVPEKIADQPAPEKIARTTGSGKSAPVVCEQTNEVFPSIAALAQALKLPHTKVWTAVTRGSELNGMKYSLVETAAATTDTARKPVSKPPRSRAASSPHNGKDFDVPPPPTDANPFTPVDKDWTPSELKVAAGTDSYKGLIRIAFVEIEDASPQSVAAVMEQLGAMFDSRSKP